ncbi:unnamed protein product [Polarella glacialis]|uniref:catechol O-methyltransferase n=1 Tax=Polarella glacialis TaxID=89957 RepID=A0A813L523_POLGL|nr:unnamed protein product [Polarella glacialis]CAE8716822.1 unnamed protein product [Polarella glacialis]
METEQRGMLPTELSLTHRLSAAARCGDFAPELADVLELSPSLRAEAEHSSSGVPPTTPAALLAALGPRIGLEVVSRPTGRLLPYQRELLLLREVLAKAKPGSPARVARVLDAAAEASFSWAKFAGGSKAAALLAAMRGGPPTDTSRSASEPSAGVLEIGTYIGNSALRLAITLPGVRVTTIELDPVLVAIARSLIAFAGLTGFVSVLTGHSKLLLPRLQAHLAATQGYKPRPCFSAVFMDRWGTQYDEDFALIQEHGLLQEDGGVLVADNVLTTAAASFLWRVAAPGSGSSEAFASQIASVTEVADRSKEDWVSVSVSLPNSRSATIAPQPDALARLQAESEKLREIVTSGGSSGDHPDFVQRARATLVHAGIFPMSYEEDTWTEPQASDDQQEDGGEAVVHMGQQQGRQQQQEKEKEEEKRDVEKEEEDVIGY